MKSWQRCMSVLIVLALAALVLGGCGGQQDPTPVPTATPAPTATPRPTAVPTPTPVPLSAIVDQGYAALARSDFAAAVELFEQATATGPAYGPAYAGLALASYWQIGEEPKALELASKAVEVAPDDAEAHAALALAHYNLGDTDAAVEAAEKAVELDQSSPLAQVALATAYLSDRQYEESLAAIETALDLQPDLAEACGVLGAYYRAVGDAGRAQAAYEAALSRQPDFAPWHVALADLWADLGRYGQARARYEQAVELDPQSAEALRGLAYLAVERGDYGAAGDLVDQFAALIPGTPQPYVARGYIHSAQGEGDDARAQLRRALDRRENYGPALDAMGWSYLDEGECDLAVRQFQTLVAEHPRSPDGLIGMGYARLCDGDPAKALEYMRKAARLDPYAEWAQMGLGAAYGSQERWEEATLAYADALQVGLTDAAVHRELGDVIYYSRDDPEAVDAEFELALQLMPDDVGNQYAHASLGFVDYDEGQADLAEAHAREALAMGPEDPLARRLLGMALVRQGKHQEAIEVLEALIAEEPEDSTAQGFLGLAYKGVGRYPEAKKALETYVALQRGEGIPDQTYGLIEILGQGYVVAEAKALRDMASGIEEELETEATVQITKVEGAGRTVNITLAAQPDQEPEDVLFQMAAAVGIASVYLQRIEPAIEGGITVQLVDEGEPLYAMTVDHATAVEFADGLIGGTDLASTLEFRQLREKPAAATVEEIKTDLSATRELSATTEVPYQTLAEEELRARYEAEMEEEDRATMEDQQALLVLLGVVDPQVDLAQLLIDLNAEQVSGFYDTDEEAFYLVERGASTVEDQMTVAHEYVHALQDQHYDLDALVDSAESSDQEAAIEALVEGDATLAMLLYGDEHVMLYDMFEMISEAGGLESEVLDTSPAFIRESAMFPYDGGLDFVMALYDRGGWDAVNEAYQAPPRSTEQVLHPERYRQDDQPVAVALPEIADALDAAWQEVDRDVMGELGLRLYLQEHAGPMMAALAAEGWAGDSYALLRRGPEGPHLLVMQTAWDDEEEADQFWTLFLVAMSHQVDLAEDVQELLGEPAGRWWHGDGRTVFARQDGEEVLILIGPDRQTLEAATGALESAPVTG